MFKKIKLLKMKAKNSIKTFFFLYMLFILSKCAPNQQIIPIQLNIPETGSLNDNSYAFYQLTLKEISLDNQENLILRADEDRSGVSDDTNQYQFSDPDLYVSQKNRYPKDADTSTWYCNELGNDIVAIPKENVRSNNTFYISVFCKKKCKFILNSYLSASYFLNPFKIYGVHINPKNQWYFNLKQEIQIFII